MNSFNFLYISSSLQRLFFCCGDRVLKKYRIATSRYGLGEEAGSYQTPRGWHTIRAMIGANCPINTVFVGRRPTGEIYSEQLARQYPERDWILTRILWLSGLEVGKNRLSGVDTMRRYIYIHGTPDAVTLGEPSSHGCIRVHNADLLDLYEQVRVGDRVFIA